MSTRRVTTFHDGTGWSYRIEGELEPGHHFDDRSPAVAGGRYLAQSLGAELVIENVDGSLRECRNYGDTCSCHAQNHSSAGD